MTDLQLNGGFYATADRYLWHPQTATVILADMHLGVEHTLASRGMPIPPVHLPALRRAWSRLAERLASVGGPSRLIIAGDFFDTPNPPAATIADARLLFEVLPTTTAITLLPGNHDPSPQVLQTLFDSARVQVALHATVAEYLVIHGDKAPFPAGSNATAGFIVGHQHPAVVLRNAVQSAKMICFAGCTLRVRGQAFLLLILPTFSPMPLGSNLLTEHHWILDLPRPAAADIRIAGIVRDQVLDFGPLDHL